MGSTEVVVAVNPLTVQERIKRSQDLAKQSTDQLAASKGLVTAPVTAVGTGAIGGTPQQQAMAGTPAQKQGALAAAVAKPLAGETGLEQAMKVKPQAAIDTAKAKEMDRFSASLGTFGDKVNQWIEGVLATTTAADTGLKAKLELTEDQKKTITDTIAKLPPEAQGNAQTRIDDALIYLTSQGGLDNETMARQAIETLNEMLGRDTVDKLLAGTQYEGLWQDISKTTAGQLETGVQQQARGADSKLTLQDITDLGTSPAEIAQLLGIKEEQVAQLTLGDFQQQLQRVGQQQFGETQQVAANIASALVSETEREALRGTMRELEEAGIAGVEGQFQQLINDIEQGSVITIAGKTYSIEEFLAEGTISRIAEQYYDGDKELADRLAAEEPQLKKWLDDNKAGLTALIAAGSGRAQELKTHNETEDAIRKEVNDAGLLEGLDLKDANYKPGTVLSFGEKPDWSKGGTAIQGIIAMKPEQRPKALSNLSSTLTSAQTSGLDVNELKNSDPNLFLDDELVAEYNNKAVQWKMTQQTLKSNDPIEILNTVLADDTTLEEIQKILEQDAYLVSINQEPSEWWDLTGGDGTLDLADAQAIAKSSIRPPSLKGAAKRDNFGMDALKVKDAQISGSIADFTERFWENDKQVTADEIIKAYQDGTATLSNMLNWYQAMGRPGPDDPSPSKRALFYAYSKVRDIEVAKEYNAMGYGSDGFPEGLKTTIADGLFKDGDFGKLDSAVPVLENAIKDLTKYLNRTTNPDIKWRVEQNLAELQNNLNAVLSKIDDILNRPLSNKNDTTKRRPGELLVEGIEDLGGDISQGAKQVVESVIVNPIRKSYRI